MNEAKGLIIKRMDYKESSKIIFVYTDSGKKSFLVQGANKLSSPFLSSTEVLTHVKIISQGKDLETVRDIEVLEAYAPIKQDLEKYTYTLHMLEILYHVADAAIDHSKLFLFLGKLLPLICSEVDYIPYVYMFETKLLYLLGIQPEFRHCVACSKTNDLVFSVSEGGFCCKDHFPAGKTYSMPLIKDWAGLYYYDLSQSKPIHIAPQILRQIRQLLDEYYQFHLNFETKSRKVLKGLLGY